MSLLRGVTIGQHYPLDSRVHRLDPCLKILMILIYIIALFTSDGLYALMLLGAYMLLAALLSRLPGQLLWRGLRPVLWIAAFTVLTQPLMTTGGTLLWSYGVLRIYSRGVWRGLLLGYRLLLMMLASSLLTLTTSPLLLTSGMEDLLSVFTPLGLPVPELAMMMSIALRFVPTLAEEAEKIAKAQMARGVDFEQGHLLQRLRSFLPVLVPLIVSSLRRADELALAMEARGYHGGSMRTRYRVTRRHRDDWLALASLLLLWIVIVMLRFAPGSGVSAWMRG